MTILLIIGIILGYGLIGAIVSGLLARALHQQFEAEETSFSMLFWPVGALVLVVLLLVQIADLISGGRIL